MQQVTIKQVDAFTTLSFSGNPAGVITDASELPGELMQKIAAEMSLFETCFVSNPTADDAAFRIRFFTPTKEVDVSGHVMIAACYALIEEGRIELQDGITRVIFQTNLGNMPIDIHFHAEDSAHAPGDSLSGGVPLSIPGGRPGILDKIVINQKVKSHRLCDIPVGEIASILGIHETAITKTGLPLEIVSTGLEQLLVPIDNKDTILNMHPDLIKLSLLDQKYGIDTNHIFSLDTFNEESASYSRHFAPRLGMWEDVATGTAAAGLGTYLLRHGVVTSGTMLMEQGKEEGCLASILVEIDEPEKNLSMARIGGLAVTSMTRTIRLEEGKIEIC
jgi:trans-2,3-dihydro-3-hydroxyanthranilate isomerase